MLAALDEFPTVQDSRYRRDHKERNEDIKDQGYKCPTGLSRFIVPDGNANVNYIADKDKHHKDASDNI